MADTNLVDRLTEIQGLRPATAQKVVDAYPTAEDLAGATQDDLTAIKGIGAVTAARIVEAFAGSPTTEAPSEPEADEPTSATVTDLDERRERAGAREQAGDTVAQLKLAAKVVGSGAVAVVTAISSHLPEVKQSVGKAAGAVVDLGREIGRAVLRRAS